MPFSKFLAGRDPHDPRSIAAIEDMKKSGLTPETLDAANVTLFNGTDEQLSKILGNTPEEAKRLQEGRALVLFPYTNLDSTGASFCRVKLIPELPRTNDKPIKYLQPRKVPTHPYISKPCLSIAKSPADPVIITEGEKKALLLTQQGLYAIALSGVWMGRENPADEPLWIKGLHSGFKKFVWSGRTVYLAFDADFRTNEAVRKALIELAFLLHGEHAIVKILTWPAERGKGIDDYLTGCPDPDAAIADLLANALPLKNFLGQEHVNEVTDAIAKTISNVASMELVVKEVAEWLGIRAATLFDACKKKSRELARQSKKVTKPSDLIEDKYSFEDGHLVLETSDGKLNLADFEAHIVEVAHGEDGEEHYLIEGESLRGGNFNLLIPAKEFGDSQKLKVALEQAMGACDSISASATKHIGPGIKRLSYPEKVLHSRIFHRTGWIETPEGYRFLIPGKEIPGTRLNLRPDEAPHGLAESPSLPKALDALDALLRSQDPEVTTLALAFVMQAPFGRLAGWEDERYCLFIKGTTGSLKTSFTQVLMSIWGPRFLADVNLLKWGPGTTGNALMALGSFAADMPFYIDNYKPNTSGVPGASAKAFVAAIQNILEGGEKKRMIDGKELRQSRKLFCWPISTGEDIPDEDAASLARCVVLHINREPGKTNPELEKAQALAMHLSAIGRRWLETLEEWRSEPETKNAMQTLFFAKRSEWIAQLSKRFPKMVTAARIASNLASNELTWMVLRQIPELAPILEQFDTHHANGLLKAATELATSTTASNEAESFLSSLSELISSRRLVILDGCPKASKETETPPPQQTGSGKYPFHGWWEPDGSLCIFPKLVLEEIRKMRGMQETITSKSLYSQLNERGAIQSHDLDQLTKSRWIAGRSDKVLHLTAGSVGGVTTPEEEDPTPF